MSSDSSGMSGLTGAQWSEKLNLISKNLRSPAEFCVIGSGSLALSGHEARTTIDLDTWKRLSSFSHADMTQACDKAGIEFDPPENSEPSRPYIQLVSPGIVQIGDVKPKALSPLFTGKGGKLTLTRPPFENIIASKLVRMNQRDIEDVTYLMREHEIDPDAVSAAIETFPAGYARDTASENTIYLAALAPAASKKSDLSVVCEHVRDAPHSAKRRSSSGPSR